MTSRFIIAGAALLAATAAGAQERPTRVVYPKETVVNGVHIREMVTLEGKEAQDYLAAQAERRATEVQAMAQAQGGGRGGAMLARVPLESKVVKGAPYSAEIVTESIQVLADGNRIVRRTTGRVYRDSQGRTRREDDIEPGRVGGVSIMDPVGQFVYSLDAASKTAWKTPVGAANMIATRVQEFSTIADPAEIERRRKLETEMATAARAGGAGGAKAGTMVAVPTMEAGVKQRMPGWDEKSETLPARNIEGVMAEGKRVTRTIPAGAIGNEQPIVSVTEEWRSPELQVLVMTRTSDPRTGESTYKLQNITRAEPNGSWFEVPADYTIKESGVRRLEPAIR